MNSNSKKIWVIVLLVGGYIALQMIADVTATKIVNLWGFMIPGGTLCFALTFTVRDLLHKRLGKEWARACIIWAGIINLGMALYFNLIVGLPAAPFWQHQAAAQVILGQVWRIALASIAAELVSELLDTELYSLFVKRFSDKFQWGRVAFSNLFSCPVDSLVFGLLAFYGQMPLGGIFALVKGQTIFKWLVAAVSLPTIYLVGERKTNS